MRVPKGFRGSSTGVWRLLKSIYGLKQASNVWYRKLRGVLERIGFSRSQVDHALFIYRCVWRGVLVHCLLAMHVDDGLAGCNSKSFLAWLKAEIEKEFGIKDLGPVKQFLGVQFERDRASRQLWIHQAEYIDNLLEEYGMLDCNPCSTPMDHAFPFGRPNDVFPAVPNIVAAFQHFVGKLLFLVLCSRPDAFYSVMRLSQHLVNPEPCHMATGKRLLRYLKGTAHYRVHYGGEHVDAPLKCFVDSDWANDPVDRASISGYVWFMAGGPISWSSKKQTTIALSSTEAEYMAITHAIQEGIWLCSSLNQALLPITTPTELRIDNTGAIALASKGSNHARSKHIDVKFHFIRLHIDSGVFVPSYIPTAENTADIMTKPLARLLFDRHCLGLGLFTL